jgi:glycosyltransferase involved in cell wall biosynthesis
MPRTMGVGDLTSPFRIRKLAKELDIQVLHGHGAKGGLNARWARIGAKNRVALNTPHGGVLNYKVGSPVGLLFRLFEMMIVDLTDGFIFESAFAQQAFFRMIARPTQPTPVIHNGLAPEEFEPVMPGPEAKDFVFIGEFREMKGIRYLIDAFAEVRGPGGRPATMVMAGDGPEMASAKAQIARLGLQDQITLLGAKPARPTLHLGRCEVVPSLAESLPYVILEAAAAARPVIATNVGGVSEIFGPTAQSLIPPADTPALQRAMQAFIDDPAAADVEMRQRLDYIRDRFSLRHMADQIEALYRQVLAARGA